MDDAAFDALDVVVISVHEVHAGDEQRLVGERAIAVAAPVAMVGHALEGLEEALEAQSRRRELGPEMLAQSLPGAESW